MTSTISFIPTIEFPCPENLNNMSATKNGAFCNSCKKEVLDISNYSSLELKQLINKNLCVSISFDSPIPKSNRYSIRQFRLALLLTFGTSLFTIANAQVKEDLNNLSTELITMTVLKTGNFLNITCESRDGRTVYSSIKIILPNGREEEWESNSNGKFHYQLPIYTRGKDILILAKGRKNTKRRSITISKDLNPEEVFFIFSNKNVKRQFFTTIGCPSF